jgi:glycerol-3-phosphate dehydrogenase (NAD(P)+)
MRDPAQAQILAERRENERYLPGVPLPASLTPTSHLAAALDQATTAVVAVPAAGVREALQALPGTNANVLIAAKGMERVSGLRLSEVASEVLGAGCEERLAVLSGPNLAGEIVKKLPTATVIASRSADTANRLQTLFGHPFFRVYTNSDVTGVELGGALKNPLAIAAGISDALGYGENTKATLLTRGLAEITRIGVASGAKASTFSGLAGLGDLLATAHSPLSRNYRLGRALGEGQTLAEAQLALGHVAEGVPTTAAAVVLAERLGVEAPVMAALYGILNEGATVAESVGTLLSRPYRDEG